MKGHPVVQQLGKPAPRQLFLLAREMQRLLQRQRRSELPRQLFIHGFLLGFDGNRMSKTRGNGMDPYPAIDAYGADALRYYLLREVGFGQDGSVGYATMHDRYHSELANELGNLVNRTTAMIGRSARMSSRAT